MLSQTARSLIEDMIAANSIKDDQLLQLRREFGADMEISAEEADILFQLDAVEKKPEDWADYFVLVMTTYLVHQGRPEGHINDAMASWLITRIDHDGVVSTETELRLLLNVLKVAEKPGERLESYALKQVKEAVMTGNGYIGRDKLTPGTIGKAEIDLLRAIFYSMGSDGGMGISKLEAQEIFALNEATAGKDNHPEWQRLFVQAIANHLMMIAAPAAPSTQELLKQEKWLEDTEISVTGFWSNLSPTSIVDAFKETFGLKSNAPQSFILDKAAMEEAEEITYSEASWLVQALQKDGGIDPNERALLDFIRAECPAIDAQLKPLLDAA